jgi:colanic acid/amylovoran biosynthesis protein
MKVLVTNSLVLNGGEAATARALVDLLRRAFGPETEVIVYDLRAEEARPYYPDLRLRPLLWRRASRAPAWRGLGEWIGSLDRARFRKGARMWRAGRRRAARFLLTAEEIFDLEAYASADLIVSSGGTYLVANYDIRPRLLDFEISLLFDRPLVFFTQSMGPFRPETREALRKILDRAALVLLRDDASLRHLRSLGVENPAVHLGADAVFALRSGEPGRSSAAPPPRSPGGGLRAAISVRDWHYFKTLSKTAGMNRYRSAIAAATTHLVRERGAEISFLSTCQGIPAYWFDDGRVAQEIASSLDPEVRRHVRVDGAFRTPERLLEELRGFDFVIATRFHMAILAMLAGVPPLALAYESKTDELYRRIGIPHWVHDIEQMDGRLLCERVDRCLAELPQAREILSREVASERARALEAADLLREVVARRAPRPNPGLEGGASLA